MELLIGCGSNRTKKLAFQSRGPQWDNLHTLDIDQRCNPDTWHDLNDLPLPFPDNSCDEIHAYDVLEHCGSLGDFIFFFRQWQDFWRILKPGGVFFGIVPLPTSPWAWADPGHTRLVPKESLVFLHQPSYAEQVGATPMTDYRSLFTGDFDHVMIEEDADSQSLRFALRAVKPSRCVLLAAASWREGYEARHRGDTQYSNTRYGAGEYELWRSGYHTAAEEIAAGSQLKTAYARGWHAVFMGWGISDNPYMYNQEDLRDQWQSGYEQGLKACAGQIS